MKNYRQFHIGVGFVTLGAIITVAGFHCDHWYEVLMCFFTAYIQFSCGLDAILWAKD